MRTKPKRDGRAQRDRLQRYRPARFRGVTGAYGTRLLRAPRICADSTSVVLRYTDTPIMEHGVGGFTNKIYRANSVHDPDASLGGGSCRGHSAWSALYQKYRVTAVRITASTYILPAVNGTLVVMPYPGTMSDPTTSDQVMGAAHSKYITYGNANPGPQNTVTMYIPMNRIMGVPYSKVINEDDYSSAVNDNPPTAIRIAVTSFGTISVSPQLIVTLDYYVTYFDRRGYL